MEGLDFSTLYVALSQGQVDSILGAQRFGLRVSKEDAVQRSHDFAEWERLYVTRGGEVLTHKDFYYLRYSSISHWIPPEEPGRCSGSDEANRVSMERRNST